MELKPSEIRYSQDSINNVFRERSVHANRRIGTTLDDLCEGRCTVDSIPEISVMKINGHWTTGDNRRLWVFRQLERLGKCDTIPVETTFYIPEKKLSSNNGGRSIFVRNRGPGGIWYTRPDASKRGRIDEMSRTSNGTYSTSSPTTTSNILNDIEQRHFRTGRSLIDALSTTSSSTPSPRREGIDEMSRTSNGTYSTSSRNLRTERSFRAFSTTSSRTHSSLNYQTPSRFGIFGNSTTLGHLAVNEQDGVTDMDPMKLKYTKTLISATFDDGKPLISLKESLLDDMTSARSVPPLDVHKAYGFYYVIDGNRRLNVFRDVRQHYDLSLRVKVMVTDMEDDEDDFVDTIRERYPNLQLFDILKMGDSVTVT